MKKILGLLAVAGLLAIVAPSVPAQALSLATPGIAGAVQQGGPDSLVTEVRGGHGRGHGFGRHHGWNRGHHYGRRHHGFHRGRHHHHRRFR